MAGAPAAILDHEVTLGMEASRVDRQKVDGGSRRLGQGRGRGVRV